MNKQTRPIEVRDYAPKGDQRMISPTIPYLDGEASRREAAALLSLADQAGRFADRAAAIEGEREGRIAGADPNFRPRNSSTIRGAAYDRAGVNSYLDSLDANVRTDMLTLFEQHKNDPAALREAYDALERRYTDEHVFPEIAGAFRSSFSRLRTPFQRSAAEALEGRQRDQAQAANILAANVAITTIDRAASAAPFAPETAETIRAEVQAQSARIQRDVDAGNLSADAGMRQRIALERAAAVRLREAQIAGIGNAQGLEAWAQTFEADFAAGKLPDVDADAAALIRAEIRQRRTAITSQITAANNGLRRDLEAVVDRAVEGIPVPADEFWRLRTVAEQSEEGAAALASAERRIMLARTLRTATPEQIEESAQHYRTLAAGPDGTPDDAAAALFLDKMASDRRTALASDPLGEARRQGLEIPPLDLTDPNTIEASIRGRLAAADALADTQGRAPRYLRPDDLAAIGAVLQRSPDEALAAVEALTRGAGAQAPKVLEELGDRMPALAQAGALLTTGVPQTRQTALDILEGVRLANAPDARAPSLPSRNAELFREVFGDSLIDSPQLQQRLHSTARSIYQARAARLNLEPTSREAEELMRESYRAAAGEVMVNGERYGGSSTYRPEWGVWSRPVVVPPQIRADRFQDVIRSLRDEDLATMPGGAPADPNGRPYTAAQIRGGIPVRVNGGYRFALGDPASSDPRYIMGADGQPFVLPTPFILNTLGRRAPGALIGGE